MKKINSFISDFVGGTSNGGYMKKGFFFLFTFLLLGMVACDDDDDDEFVTPAGAVINEEDAEFSAEASEYNNAQIVFGQLALERSTNEQVRAYAQSIIDQHTTAQQGLTELAASKGIALPIGLSDRQERQLEELRDEGGNFDESFLDTQERLLTFMELDFNDYIDDGRDQDILNYANTLLPVIDANETIADDLEETVD